MNIMGYQFLQRRFKPIAKEPFLFIFATFLGIVAGVVLLVSTCISLLIWPLVHYFVAWLAATRSRKYPTYMARWTVMSSAITQTVLFLGLVFLDKLRIDGATFYDRLLDVLPISMLWVIYVAGAWWVAGRAANAAEHRIAARIQSQHVHCRNCGYDLRASAERCPECGTPFTLPTHYVENIQALEDLSK